MRALCHFKFPAKRLEAKDNFMHAKNFSQGFSLVELMVVVAVIAILAAVALPAYINHIMRVRQSTYYDRLLDIKAAQEMYYAQYDTYATMAEGDTFTRLFGFDPGDSTYYLISAGTADANGFTISFNGKTGTMLSGDCMQVSHDTDPVSCGEPAGFSLSLMFR